jgi:hypothetical protein
MRTNPSYFNHPFNPTSWLRPILLLAVLANSLAAANSYLVHNLASDVPGVADQTDAQLVNPWDFTSFNVCLPVGSASCTPPDVSSVLIANNGIGMVSQYTPIPEVVGTRILSLLVAWSHRHNGHSWDSAITHRTGHFLAPAQHMPIRSPEPLKRGPDHLRSPSLPRRQEAAWRRFHIDPAGNWMEC